MDKDRYGKRHSMRTKCHFLDLEDSFISRIELNRFEVVFIYSFHCVCSCSRGSQG
jgi:hypothetical protein